ncbi:MAG: hypothetical protein KDJ52_17265 [Anaerolineae bacterium]|nr:hypothetical protein [Anaerolineae bacterium]
MEIFVETMGQRRIKLAFETYDVGHLHNLKEPLYLIQFVPGALGGLAAPNRSRS